MKEILKHLLVLAICWGPFILFNLVVWYLAGRDSTSDKERELKKKINNTMFKFICGD